MRMNIASLIFSRCTPDSPAFVRMEEEAFTYEDLELRVRALVSQLKRLGCEPGDRIALTVPRGPWGLIGILAVSSLAICCPLDPKLKDEELEAALDQLSIKLLVDGTGDARLRSLAAKRGLKVFTAPFGSEEEPDHRNSTGDNLPCLDNLTSSGDVALLLQTSGTTSRPKPVALTHANVAAAALAIGAAYEIGPQDLCLNPMPHHHVHGLISAGLSSLMAGAAQHCTTSFSADAFEAAYAAFRPTWFTGSPAFHLGLFDHFKFTGTKPARARLRFMRSSSAPFPASVIASYEDMFGVALLENYGMTETASTICTNPLPPQARKAGSVGRPIGSQIRIVDANGWDHAVGEEGEIIVRGPSVITRYGADDSVDGSFLGSWLRTGDIGRFDADGYLFVLGRTKELIKRGGHSVYPLEVDNVLLAYKDVAEAICFAIDHPTLGEELVAVVVPRPQAEIDVAALRDFLEQRLSTYKVPNAVYVVREIPKNDTGKAVRRDMKKKFDWLFVPKLEQPRSELEEILVQFWTNVLGQPAVGATDNVFVLGADTLRAQKICDLVRAKTGISLQLRDVLRNPTVRSQSILVESRRDGAH